MPTVLLVDGFRFHFFSNENEEPPHIHVRKQGGRAKYWLDPVTLAYSEGFNISTVNKLYRIVIENRTLFLEAWNDYFDR